MTNKEIEAFALQYHGIECVKVKGIDKLQNTFDWIHEVYRCNESIEHIELRSIESLTDEEAVNCKTGYFSSKEYLEEEIYNIENNTLLQYEIDYLRSIGVAVGFRGHTVEQMIDLGVLKLKDA